MKNKIMALIAFVAIATISKAQISGTVFEIVDGNKQTLFGANVYWENSSVGTISDMNGNFKINKVNTTNKLIVSFIGYNSDTLEIPEKNTPLGIINLFRLYHPRGGRASIYPRMGDTADGDTLLPTGVGW